MSRITTKFAPSQLGPRLASVTHLPAWIALQSHAAQNRDVHLRALFAGDPGRGERYCAQAGDIYFDYSKQRITGETMRLLMQLASERDLQQRIEALFSGEKINVTEQRAALHMALRAPARAYLPVDGDNVVPAVHEVLHKMKVFCDAIRSGCRRGYSGKRIRNVVNIGIGGSHLGPALACDALRAFGSDLLHLRFVSNVDSTAFAAATADLAPDETLFIICSKTFTTVETSTNARTARQWMLDALRDEKAIRHHFAAVSCDKQRAVDFGIHPDDVFGFWDWVGGRYSLCSAIGMSVMLAIGPENFHAMLQGFHRMDEHFRTEPMHRNLPVLMAMLGIWNTNFLHAPTVAIVPYAQRLSLLPAFLQQLTMESNGKSATLDGQSVSYDTCPVYWGQVGTDSQHSFFQLLHQGTQLIPVDFIGFCQAPDPLPGHLDLLMANLFAQGEALAFGKSATGKYRDGLDHEGGPHHAFEGNRPSSTLLLPGLTPATLGQLIALYEHCVFVQGVIWNIGSFDQWGVELGKQLAGRIAQKLASGDLEGMTHDSSTSALIRRYLHFRQAPSAQFVARLNEPYRCR